MLLKLHDDRAIRISVSFVPIIKADNQLCTYNARFIPVELPQIRSFHISNVGVEMLYSTNLKNNKVINKNAVLVPNRLLLRITYPVIIYETPDSPIQ